MGELVLFPRRPKAYVSQLRARIERDLADALARDWLSEVAAVDGVGAVMARPEMELLVEELPRLLRRRLESARDAQSDESGGINSLILRYIVWGNEVESRNLRQMLGWRQRWRQLAGELLLHSLEFASGELHDSPFLSDDALNHAWLPAALKAQVDVQEATDLIHTLQIIRHMSSCAKVKRPHTAGHQYRDQYRSPSSLSRVRLIESLFFSRELPYLFSPPGKSKPTPEHELFLSNGRYVPEVSVSNYLSQFVQDFSSALVDPYQVIALLSFRASSRFTCAQEQAIKAGSDADQVPDMDALLDTSTEKYAIRITTGPLDLLYRMMAMSERRHLELVFDSSDRTATNQSIATVTSTVPDAIWIQLLDLLVERPATMIANPVEYMKLPSLGYRPLSTIEFSGRKEHVDWVVPVRQWSFWARHPSVFHRMCTLFGAPKRHLTPVANEGFSMYNDTRTSNMTDSEWPVIAPMLLGLGSEHTEESTSLWYSMANTWTEHRCFLGLCPPKMYNMSKEVCACVYCTVFRLGWNHAFAALNQKLLPLLPELVQIVWHFLLYDPREALKTNSRSSVVS